MTNLYDGQITDLLNNGFRYNPETIAVAYAVREEKRRILALAARTRLMSAIDNLDERILDILAVELRTPAYQDSFPLDVKRTLVKGTLPFYAKLGTPSAVNWLIQTIFGAGHIEEWWDYDGYPHHFRAYVGSDGSAAITPENLQNFRRMVASVKRLSSWLDDIVTFTTMAPAKVYPAPTFRATRSTTWLPNLEPKLRGAAVYISARRGRGLMTTKLPTLELDPKPSTAVLGVAGATHSYMRTKLPTLQDYEVKVVSGATAQISGKYQTMSQTKLPTLKEETA